MPTQSKQKPCKCQARPANSRARTGSDSTVDQVFRAFSERTRLRILHLLLDGEMCVGDIVTILETTQPRASQHLAYLRRAGLVVTRRAGLWSFYSLAPARTPFHNKLLECLHHCFSEVPELQADVRRAAELQREGRCCCDSRG